MSEPPAPATPLPGGEAPAPGPRAGERVELRIDSLAAGGDGVGRTADGRVVFVPLTAPGDRVRARLEVLRPRWARAELEEVLEPAAGRVTPRCEVFGQCGGCSWQHLDYAIQCDAKRRIVEDALARVGHLELAGPVAFVPSPDPYGYRSRARLAVRAGEVGYRRRRSHDVCAVRHCPVLTDAADARLRALAEAPPKRGGDWELAVGAVGERAHALGARARSIELDVDGARLRVSAGVFFQANAALHGALVDSVARAAGSGSLALELFAGAGFLTLRLARAFDRVVAVESGRAAIADLRHNLARAGRQGVEVLHARAEAALGSAQLRELRPDAVVLDPPRTGLASGAAEALCALEPRRVVYLSCDPATLARDLAVLVGRGLVLEAVEAFDLFPQTPHVEVLASLRG